MIRSTDLAFGLFLASISIYLYRRRKGLHLRGPRTANILFGFSEFILRTDDLQPTYDKWAKEYGSIFQVPRGLGTRAVVIYDPAAANHILAQLGTNVYERPEFSRALL